MVETFIKLKNQFLQNTLKAAHLDLVPRSIQSIILGLAMIQPLSFLHQPSKTYKAIHFNSHEFNYLSLVDYFTLPQFDNIVLFPLIFMLSFGIIPLILLQFEMKQKPIFMNSFAVYIQLSQYFNLPFACHCIRNLENNFVISTITLIILILSWSGIIYFHKETFTMKMDYFQQLNTSILDLLYHISELGLILNYQFLSESTNSVVIQSMVVFGMGILQIGIVYSFQICNQIQLQITVILGGSMKILLSILYFTNINLQNDCISLLIIPLLALIIEIIYTRYEDALLLNLLNGTLNQMEYYFAKLINNQFTIQRQKLQFYAQIIMKFNEIDFTIKSRISPMSEFVLDLYPRHMFKYFNMLLIGNIIKMQDQISTSQYLHYIAILSNLKFYYPALQQVNILTMKMQQVKRGFIESSNFQPSHTSEYRPRRSITTSQQKSYNIVKDSNVLIFKQIPNLSAIDRQKAFILKELVVKELSGEFQKISDSSNLALGIQMFLSSETSNLNLKSELINLINQKVQFLRLLINPTQDSQIHLFTSAKAIARKLQYLEVKLNDLYQGFPSLRMKSVIQFYQGEIVNNHLEALKLKNSSSFSDERLVGLFKNVALTFLSNNIVYLHLGFQQDSLIFLNSSEKAHKFFNCRQDLFKRNNEIQFLLPEVVRQCHGMLIQRFLVTNKSKFYLSPNLAFFQQNQILITPCKLYFNVDLSQDNLSFYSFFQEYPTSSAFIMVSENHKITGITANFFEKINQDIKKYNDALTLKNLSIEKLLNGYPNFPQDSLFESQLTIIKPNGNREQQRQFLNFTVQLISKEIVNDCYTYSLIEIKDFEQKTDHSFYNEPIEINIDIELSEIEATVQQPNELILENYQIQTSKKMIGQPKVGVLSPSMSNLMSPHNNSNLINESSRIPKLQQDYFVAPHQDASLSLQKSKFLELNSNPPRNDQEEFNDQGSQCSSLIGIKTSLYFKKYDLMGKLLTPTYPTHLKLFIFFLLIQMTLCSIYWLLTLTTKQTDLSKIVNEIDMIQLHSGFMGPHDAFLAMRSAIVLYQQYVGMKILTSAQYSEKTKQLVTNIAVGYNDMKATYEEQQTNPNLVNFFTNKNITVIFMKENATIVYPMVLNIRESLQTLVQYFYQILRVFQAQQSPANKPFQVYQAANIFNFHYFLEEITISIYNFSKNRSTQINQQWTQIYVIFLLLSFVFTLIFLNYYRLFHQIFDKYMYIFQSCDVVKISREIDRLKDLISQLQSEQDALFSYHFDLELKEKFLEQEMNYIQKEKLNDYKELEPKKPISILKKVSFYSSLWILFLITSTVVNQITVQSMEKYSQTVDFYKLIQDMQFTSAPLYTYRDLRYLWNNFTYLTELDLEREYQTIEQGKSNINRFNLFCQNFQPSLYQVQQSFIDFFEEIQQKPLCSVLTKEELGYLEYYCNITLEGNLNNGLIVSLNFMKSQIETEQSINNFTRRITFNFYENEGGILLIKVFQIMTQKLKQSMINDTQSQSDKQIGISIGYLIFLLTFMTFISVWIYQSLLNEYLTTKRFIQILPIGCFFLDDQMDRTLRKLLQIK